MVDKINPNKVVFPREGRDCKYCFINRVYNEKYGGRTNMMHNLRDLATDEMLAHKSNEICVDCRKIEAICFSGNRKKIFGW